MPLRRVVSALFMNLIEINIFMSSWQICGERRFGDGDGQSVKYLWWKVVVGTYCCLLKFENSSPIQPITKEKLHSHNNYIYMSPTKFCCKYLHTISNKNDTIFFNFTC